MNAVQRTTHNAWCGLVKHWGQIVSVAMVAVLIGVGGQLILGRTQAPFWIIYGGNTDTGDGNGGGMARQQMIDGGWTSEGNSFQVTYQAQTGTPESTRESGFAAGQQAWNDHCRNNPCIIAGFSQGGIEAIELSQNVGNDPHRLYLFGSPQPQPGIWHSVNVGNPVVAFWVQQYGFRSDTVPPAGTQAFMDKTDVYANMAPQCEGPGLYRLQLNGHRIIAADEPQRVWTDDYGTVIHEVDPGGFPEVLSGADPSPPEALCPPGGWKQSEQPQPGPDAPAPPTAPVPGLNQPAPGK